MKEANGSYRGNVTRRPRPASMPAIDVGPGGRGLFRLYPHACGGGVDSANKFCARRGRMIAPRFNIGGDS
jgi:hypothetical protein